MRFSLITITYNSERYLRQTLESVACQEFKDFEHILWDGGSRDGTLDIARQFPHLKIYQGVDSGISDAMNRGAEFAQGDFLLHLHSDDLLAHSKTLSLFDKYLELHPHLKWIYGRAHIIDEMGNLKKTTPYEPFSHKRLLRYNFITHPATLISQELFKSVGGFKKELRYCMDYDLWLRLSCLTKPMGIPSVVSSFREHTHSLSTSEPLKVSDEAYQVRKCYTRSIWDRYRSYRVWKKRRSKIGARDA